MTLPAFLRLKAETNELLRLDLLRFIAATGIVVMHMASMLVDAPSELGAILTGLRMFVDMFFVISGLVIAKFYSGSVTELNGYLTFLRRRIARLVPLHWATLGLYVGLWAAAFSTGISLNDPSRYDMSCLGPNLLLIHSFNVCSQRTFNFVTWSISAEIGMYVIFPALVVLTRPISRFTCLIAAAAALGLAFADPAWSGRTFDWGVLRALPPFLFGIGLYQATALLQRLPWAGALAGLSTLSFIIAALLRFDTLLLLFIAFASVATTYAADIQSKPSALVARLGPLGQLTYSLYMLHPVIMTFGITLAGRVVLHLDGQALNLWVGGLFFIALPVAACASLYYFETPLRKLISGGHRSSIRRAMNDPMSPVPAHQVHSSSEPS